MTISAITATSSCCRPPSGADTATDLKTCKVYISVLGGEEALQETLAGLKAAEGFLRRMLARNLNLRNTPELLFLPDRSIEYGMHISGILDELHESGRFAAEEELPEPVNDGKQDPEEADD